MAHLKDLIVNGASRFIGKAYGAFVGSFSGNLDGNATTSTTANTAKACSGNAATASKLSTARKINITGNATGAATFDGTSDVSINVNVSQATNATKAASFVGGKVGGSWVSGMNQSNSIIQWTMAGVRDGSRYDPIMWGKDTEGNVWNLGWAADGGVGFSGYKAGRTDNGTDGGIYFDPKTGITRGNFLGTLNGNASTATKLATARAISLTGNASGSANFDGSGNVSINTTVNESKHAAAATALDIFASRPSDANIQKGDGLVRYFLATSNMTSNKPMGDAQILHLAWDNNGGWDAQLAIAGVDGDIQARSQNAGKWGAWKTFLNDKNYNDYAPTKTGGGASGTWDINISGNAVTATKATTALNIPTSDVGGNIWIS